MKRISFLAVIALPFAAFLASCEPTAASGTPIPGTAFGHESSTVDGITAERVQNAKDRLRIAYWHTSHGSQLIVGVGQQEDGTSLMDEHYGGAGWYLLDLPTRYISFANGLYIEEPGPSVCQYVGEAEGWDLDISIGRFAADVRAYLDAPVNAGINVVMASWCGGASNLTPAQADHYLSAMNGLEADYPRVVFVYMTGHADGTGLTGNLHARDAQIRAYCEANDKWLFEFYDIECYDPDGEYFGDRFVNDVCEYDADGDPSNGIDGNWALEWQAANPADWWDCPTDYHTQPLNRNMKARAAWQLWCAIADAMAEAGR